MENNNNNKVICLNSGGFDSVVLMHHLVIDLELEVVSLSFNYGQANSELELAKARECAEKLNLEHVEINLPKFDWSKSSLVDKNIKGSQYLAYRNLIFGSYAVSMAESLNITDVFMAIIDTENANKYKDTTEDFYDNFNILIEDSGITIHTPFIQHTKLDLLNLARRYRIGKNDFYTCNTPINNKPCGTCDDCLLLEIMYLEYEEESCLDTYINSDFTVTEEFLKLYKNKKITNLKVIVNNDCQFSCSHCLYNFKDLKKELLTTTEWLEFFKDAIENGVTYFDFGGKEPLYDDKIFTYLDFLKSNNVTYGLITNGFNISKYISQIKKYKPQVTLSVESLSELYNRNSNSHIKDNIKLLVKNNINTSISLDLHKGNLNEVTDIIKNLKSLGIKDIYIKPIIPRGNNGKNVVTLKPNEIIKVLNSIKNITNCNLTFSLDMYSLHLLKENKVFMEFINEFKETRVSYFGNVLMKMEFFCARAFDSLSITADGFIQGCGVEVASNDYSKIAFGNIKNSNFKDLIYIGKSQQVSLLRANKKIGCFFCKNHTEMGCLFKKVNI